MARKESSQSQKDEESNDEELDHESPHNPDWAEAKVTLEDGETLRLGLGDAVKKIVSAGVGAAFMTEEHIRSYVSELRLPKEALNYLLQNANRSKTEITNRVSSELVKMVNRIDLVQEASRFAEEHKFRVSAEIEVIPKKEKKGSDEPSTPASSSQATEE